MYRTNVINQVFKSQIFIKNDVRDIRQILLSVCSLCRSKWTMVWLWISVKLSFSLHHGRCLQTAYRVMEVKQRVSHMDCRALIGWSAHYFHVKCFHRPLALTMLDHVMICIQKVWSHCVCICTHFYWYGGPLISKTTDAWDLYQADLCVCVMSEMAICFLLSVSDLSTSEEICGLLSKCDPLHREEAKGCLHSWTLKRLPSLWGSENDGRNAVNKLSDSLPTRMSHTSRDDVNHTPKAWWWSDLVVEHRLQDADEAYWVQLHKASQSVINSITNSSHISSACDTWGFTEVMVPIWEQN